MWKVTLNNTDGHSHSPVAADTSLCRPDQEKTNQIGLQNYLNFVSAKVAISKLPTEVLKVRDLFNLYLKNGQI